MMRSDKSISRMAMRVASKSLKAAGASTLQEALVHYLIEVSDKAIPFIQRRWKDADLGTSYLTGTPIILHRTAEDNTIWANVVVDLGKCLLTVSVQNDFDYSIKAQEHSFLFYQIGQEATRDLARMVADVILKMSSAYDTMVPKTADSHRDVPEEVQEFMGTIESYAKKAFPEGTFGWKDTKSWAGYQGPAVYDLYFTMTTTGKDSWRNGIVQNDPSFNTWHIFSAFDMGGFKSPLKVEMSQGGKVYGPNSSSPVKAGWRDKTGTPDQILKHMQGYFAKLWQVYDTVYPDR